MPNTKNRRIPIVQTLPLFGKFFVLVLIALLLLLWGIYQSTVIRTKNDIVSNENLTSLILNNKTAEVIKSIRSDINFLSRQVEHFYIFEKADFERHLDETFFEYSVSKKIYD